MTNTKTSDLTTPTFRSEDGRAVDAIARKRDDLARAFDLAPALVPILEAEIATCEASLERARLSALEYERERDETSRAVAKRQQALGELNTSLLVDTASVSRIVQAAEAARYLEGAYKRRADAAHSAATSAYFRAQKDIAERVAAVTFAERLAGAVIDRDETRVPAETRASVIAWLPLVLQVEGRAAYERSLANRTGNRSYPTPPPAEDYDRACQGVFAGVQRLREQVASQAAELAAVSP